ncbi:hypothetical protein [Streptomyces broussonetiae]|nr:hypothetical protein [Streptomyces broussonetiae]
MSKIRGGTSAPAENCRHLPSLHTPPDLMKVLEASIRAARGDRSS